MRKWKLLEVYHKQQEWGWIWCLWIPGPGFLQSCYVLMLLCHRSAFYFLFTFNILYFSKANTFLIMYNNLVRFEHIGPGRTSEGRDLPEVSLLRLCLSRSVRCSCVGYLCWRTWERPAMQQDPSSQELGFSPGPCAASVALCSALTEHKAPGHSQSANYPLLEKSPWSYFFVWRLLVHSCTRNSIYHQMKFFLKRLLLFHWKRIISGTGLV